MPGHSWILFLKSVERLLYRFLGTHPAEEQDWKSYAVSLLTFSFVGMLFTYGMLRLQRWLPLNPQGFGPVPADLAFNTSASFTSNTNWQNYGGESTMSYFSQMVALTFHNFASAVVGCAVAAALVRGIARDKMASIGNFWVDLIRQCLYLYLPYLSAACGVYGFAGNDPEFFAVCSGKND